MKYIIILSILFINYSCSESINKIKNDNKISETKNEIIGIWELIKSGPNMNNLILVDPKNVSYLEVKSDGTCQHSEYRYKEEIKWILTYSEDYIFDSTSKVIYNEFSNLNYSSYSGYDRKIKSYQIRIKNENGTNYLYLTSLNQSKTSVYIRKI